MNRKFVVLRRFLSRVSVSPLELVTVDDLIRFKNAYDSLGDVPVDLPYLLSADKVVVLENDKGEWFGGYAVNAGRLRYLDGFSPEQVREMEIKGGFSMADAPEITCIWRNDKIKGAGQMAPIFLYYSSVSDALALEKAFVIGGSVKQQVWENFEKALPHELFYGKVIIDGKTEMGKVVFNSKDGIQECFLEYMERLVPSKVKT